MNDQHDIDRHDIDRHDIDRHYLDGAWVTPSGSERLPIVDPASAATVGTVTLGDATDVDRAVDAARRAFVGFGTTTLDERRDLLDAVIEQYRARLDDLADAVRTEIGAPRTLARGAHVNAGLRHLTIARQTLDELAVIERRGSANVVHEPIGVCGLITPWNWPLNQIACKVAPALATGCTSVLKPSELAPLSATVFAEILHAAGVPHGVFNLVQGNGAVVGRRIAEHPDIDMVSFTGSTRAGIEVARAAAPTVKRVTQELGGKSPNVLLDDLDDDAFAAAVRRDVAVMARNSGQSCNAPTRMLVPRPRLAVAAAAAADAAAALVVGDPADDETQLGPLVSHAQYERVRGLIRTAIDEGATLVTGGLERPNGLDRGYYVAPTVFSDVENDMTIAREEVFGPVLVLIAYDDEDDAVRIANDTPYGLSAFVSGTPERARSVAARLRAGNVHLNGAPSDHEAPFGGYKQSGNGREWGRYGFDDYLETKAILGWH